MLGAGLCIFLRTMAFAYPQRSCPRRTQRSELLARLANELLDAHCDTERLVSER